MRLKSESNSVVMVRSLAMVPVAGYGRGRLIRHQAAAGRAVLRELASAFSAPGRCPIGRIRRIDLEVPGPKAGVSRNGAMQQRWAKYTYAQVLVKLAVLKRLRRDSLTY
jgi:hypothetical protein